MEPHQIQQPTDQHETLHVLDMLPLLFAACMVVLMLLAMMLTILGDIYMNIATRF